MTLTSLYIPFSGRNPFFQEQVIAAKPHILLFSKPDLADLTDKEFISNYYKDHGASKVLFANCSRDIDVTIRRKVSTILNRDTFAHTGLSTYINTYAVMPVMAYFMAVMFSRTNIVCVLL